MTRYEEMIVDQMNEAGTYSEAFKSAISALGEILEERDRVKAEYLESGGKPAVIHTLDRGQQNMKMNPLLKIWMDLNVQALSYWNALGLTAKSFKAMTGSINAKTEDVSLETIIEELGI